MEKGLNLVFVVVAVMLMFGASIFVHELGHYWVALWRRMKVEAFAIGLGPKLFSKVQNGIEYSIRWIPAGGFVRLPQMITSEALEGGSKPGAEPVPPAPPGSKIFVALAGPAMNVAFAFLVATVIYFVGLPVPVNPSIIGYVPPDSAEAKLGIQPGDRITAVDGVPVKSWQEVMNHTILARSNVFIVDIERSGVRRTYALMGKTDNSLGLKMLNLDSLDHPVVGTVEVGKPAEKGGLLPQDKFVAFAGVPIFSHEQLVEVINKRAGQPSEVVIERQGQRLTLSITPLMDRELKRGRIGISFASTPLQYEVQRPGPSPWAQVAEVWDKTIRTLRALIYSSQTGVGVKDLSGPPGILAMMAIQVNTDYRLALSFLVLLNINLAVLNLLPVPVLDGGHIMLAIIEKIRRRPLSVRLVEYTTTAFAVLLICFMVYVSFNDLKRYRRFKEVFQRTTTVEPSGKSPKTPAPVPAPAR
jgi:regulator of sigma E protease